MKQSGLAALVTMCLVISLIGPVNAQNNPASSAPLGPPAMKIKAQVETLGLGEAVTVKLNAGPEIGGTITAIRDESFTLTDEKTRTSTTVNYDVAKKVKKGLPGKRSFLDRMNPWAKVALIGGILGIVVGAAIAGKDEW
jgi:hypothetical protein